MFRMIVPLVAVFLLYPSWSVTANEYDQVSDLDYYKTPYKLEDDLGDVETINDYKYKTFGIGKREVHEREDDVGDLETNYKKSMTHGHGRQGGIKMRKRKGSPGRKRKPGYLN